MYNSQMALYEYIFLLQIGNFVQCENICSLKYINHAIMRIIFNGIFSLLIFFTYGIHTCMHYKNYCKLL